MAEKKSEVVITIDKLAAVAGRIYIVLHGDKETGGNPGLTDHGQEQIAELRQFLPNQPTAVIAGTAKRNSDTAKALQLKITAYSAIAGRPESLEPDHKNVCLADGTTVPRKMMMTTGIDVATIELLRHCQPETVILAGRPFLLYISAENVESASVYVLENGTITKIATAGGDTGAGKSEI